MPKTGPASPGSTSPIVRTTTGAQHRDASFSGKPIGSPDFSPQQQSLKNALLSLLGRRMLVRGGRLHSAGDGCTAKNVNIKHKTRK
uniref:Uncharacterized protein n=1 Tax=Globodera rostochiensis TaxID=31243 RepID=A0A914I784_GLORO